METERFSQRYECQDQCLGIGTFIPNSGSQILYGKSSGLSRQSTPLKDQYPSLFNIGTLTYYTQQ